jgi:hypothetical protein
MALRFRGVSLRVYVDCFQIRITCAGLHLSSQTRDARLRTNQTRHNDALFPALLNILGGLARYRREREGDASRVGRK